MTPEEAVKYVKGNVRVRPSDGHRHWGRARLLELNGRRATIQPWGHKTTMVVDVDDLSVWKAGNPQMFASTPPPKQAKPQEEQNMATPTSKAPAVTPPVPSMFTPELYVEAMQALKDLADAEQMAKDAAAEVVKARQKWQQLKHQLDEATKA